MSEIPGGPMGHCPKGPVGKAANVLIMRGGISVIDATRIAKDAMSRLRYQASQTAMNRQLLDKGGWTFAQLKQEVLARYTAQRAREKDAKESKATHTTVTSVRLYR